ncbi:lytic transglycosylase [Rhodobacter sp. TJ_12]|uniref:lytic transglycosylase domain-containing protein n=1 Tax=Rhodobacter sp. TJ_12 TaxID=2029399 RepID=UPI001CBE71F6|nr:lytic transglycosylase domain-containing protein [Rhodobacter sp. TJ_12]MBZ4021448.1 lytic transglycosylase [Rhodobacter sp. TJ_12]
MLSRRSLLLGACALATLSACGGGRESTKTPRELYPGETPQLRAKINRWADHYQVPRSLVHRVVQRESDYNPAARNGPYYGLMQILPQTARTMGFRGAPADLLDADTNLKYAVKYLRGAWMCADGDEQTAVMWYARGYYYEAKRRGILRETGLRT